ncbi:MAG: molybdopterin-dependent oxidoreductase [Actinomycetota bacterium]|nr:molybdopterin-dependent oxidoreductase [Actinomycetota bacterium]
MAPRASPLLVVGSLVIDLAPKWVKDATIALFGTGDKAALLVILGLVLVAGAALAGLLDAKWPPAGRILFGLGGAAAVVAAITRAGAGVADPMPAFFGTIVAVILLPMILDRIHPRVRGTKAEGRPRKATTEADAEEPGLTRRRFVTWVAVTAAAGAVAAVAGRVITASYEAVEAVRDAFTLPKPAVALPPIPAGASFDIEGISPLLTPNAEFYRIDTALQVPVIDPNDWTLKIIGLVDSPIELTYGELIALPLEESATTIACVSNEVGGNLIGTAVWLGYPIRHLLERAGVDASADMVLSRSWDGFTASTPIQALQDDRNAILAVAMNGEPLPLEHGYPVRMIVPGLYGYVSATKWVTELKVTRFADEAAYWTVRGWTERGPIKLSSRIDVPKARESVSAGDVVVAGVAWAPHTGISAVQVRIDDGDWQDAELTDPLGLDTWRQWRYVWQATAGDHDITVRAVDADGERQSAATVPPFPNGSEGLQRRSVTVS